MWLTWSRVTDIRLEGNFETVGGAVNINKATYEDVVVRLTNKILQKC